MDLSARPGSSSASREERLRRRRERERAARAAETAEEKQRRLRKRRIRDTARRAERRAAEAQEQREARLQHMRTRKQESRASETPSLPHVHSQTPLLNLLRYTMHQLHLYICTRGQRQVNDHISNNAHQHIRSRTRYARSGSPPRCCSICLVIVRAWVNSKQ